MTQFDVMVVGGGVTGVFTAIELLELGLSVVIIAERVFGEYATTRNQGWLQSGSLFAGETETVGICTESGRILRQSYSEAVDDSTQAFYYFNSLDSRNRFLGRCAVSGVRAIPRTKEQITEREPLLHGSEYELFAEVEDRVFDASHLLQLALFRATRLGARILAVPSASFAEIHKTRSVTRSTSGTRRTRRAILFRHWVRGSPWAGRTLSMTPFRKR